MKRYGIYVIAVAQLYDADSPEGKCRVSASHIPHQLDFLFCVLVWMAMRPAALASKAFQVSIPALLPDKGMAKGELCRLSGVSKASMAKLKTGQSVSVSLIEKICCALGCDYGDVMQYVPDEAKEENCADK